VGTELIILNLGRTVMMMRRKRKSEEVEEKDEVTEIVVNEK